MKENKFILSNPLPSLLHILTKLPLAIFFTLPTPMTYEYAAHLFPQFLCTYLCSTYDLNATLSSPNRIYVSSPLDISGAPPSRII